MISMLHFRAAALDKDFDASQARLIVNSNTTACAVEILRCLNPYLLFHDQDQILSNPHAPGRAGASGSEPMGERGQNLVARGDGRREAAIGFARSQVPIGKSGRLFPRRPHPTFRIADGSERFVSIQFHYEGAR
jgi:hypothetical protein